MDFHFIRASHSRRYRGYSQSARPRGWPRLQPLPGNHRLGAQGVLGGEFHLRGEVARVGNHFGNRCKARPLRRHTKLVLHMRRATWRGRYGSAAAFACFTAPHAASISRFVARERLAIVQSLMSLEISSTDSIVALGGDGKARLDHVHLHALQRQRDFELFGQIHTAAGRLFAVAQRRIKDSYLHPALYIILPYRALVRGGYQRCVAFEISCQRLAFRRLEVCLSAVKLLL